MFKVDSADIRKQLKWSRHTHTHMLARTCTRTHTSVPALLTWQPVGKLLYQNKIQWAKHQRGRLCVTVGIRCSSAGGYQQRCIAAGAPFWIGGELPVFVVRHHAPNRDACTVTVRYEYMYRATPNIYTFFLKYIHACMCIYIYIINIHSTHIYYVNKNFYFGYD